jgi:hypothetical protein
MPMASLANAQMNEESLINHIDVSYQAWHGSTLVTTSVLDVDSDGYAVSLDSKTLNVIFLNGTTIIRVFKLNRQATSQIRSQ